MKPGQVDRDLGTKVVWSTSWIKHGVLPPSRVIHSSRTRYFEQKWLRKAREILASKQKTQKGGGR